MTVPTPTPGCESGVQSPWRLIDDEPCPNDVFDVIAKYYDPGMDRFLMQRFTACIQVDGIVIWCNPFHKFYDPEDARQIKLIEHGFRPTHWAPFPDGPDLPMTTEPPSQPGRESGVWQPIETAPRDTAVLIYAAAKYRLPAFQCVAWYDARYGWTIDELRDATHWRPLPSGPDTAP